MRQESATDSAFWASLEILLQDCPLVIDRPKGSVHPRFSGVFYPLDYGFLAGSTSQDGGGVDCWRGSKTGQGIVGVVLTVDLMKKDVELKLLLDCSPEEIQTVREFQSSGSMQAFVFPRPGKPDLDRT